MWASGSGKVKVGWGGGKDGMWDAGNNRLIGFLALVSQARKKVV